MRWPSILISLPQCSSSPESRFLVSLWVAEISPRQAEVVELRFFGGLGDAEAAEVLGVSERTVRGDWRLARAMLRERLAAEDA